jgi:hypothetical protein
VNVAPQESGLASGVVNTAFMMGGALGLASLAAAVLGNVLLRAAAATTAVSAPGADHDLKEAPMQVSD